MVFSQMSHKAQSVLKVIEIDRLKPSKNQQVTDQTGVAAEANSGVTLSSPMATTTFSEEYLKPEPLFDNTMFRESDYEFFQDLGMSFDHDRDELAQTTDKSMKKLDTRANTNDTLYTPYSPQGWDVTSPLAQASFYCSTPKDSPSPKAMDTLIFSDVFQDHNNKNKIEFSEQFLDISSLPVVLGEEASENVVGKSWSEVTTPDDWSSTYHTTHYTKYTDTQNMPFIHQDDSINQDDCKYMAVIPREVERNDVVISEYLLNDNQGKGAILEETGTKSLPLGLSVDIPAALTSAGPNISTPDVLNYVEQLEEETCSYIDKKLPMKWLIEDTNVVTITDSITDATSPSPTNYRPITPKDESHIESDDDIKLDSSRKRRHDSEDSDETYKPYAEHTTTRKYKKRKSNIPLKDMILALEGSQNLVKPRKRGRPPKRRESTVSSVCSVDDNSSTVSTHEMKYRELRDKNNEASKRSRMNRKLKELQMEQVAEELEEQNKKLNVRVKVLEEMTVKLKNALMTAMTQK
ncbi:chorion b-ZIP transcription factor isoform 1-T2 [Aphomia sociella]